MKAILTLPKFRVAAVSIYFLTILFSFYDVNVSVEALKSFEIKGIFKNNTAENANVAAPEKGNVIVDL